MYVFSQKTHDTGKEFRFDGEPGLDDTSDVVAAALHINLQLLCVSVLREQSHRRGRDLTVPKDFS